MTFAPAIRAHWRSPYWRRELALAFLALASLAAIGLWGTSYSHDFYFDEAETRGHNTLGLSVAVLRGHMARYENLPEVLADFEQIRDLLLNPGDPIRVDEVNRDLQQINGQFESSDIYVMDSDGTTLAASNFDSGLPFVGENFQYRPYFFDAIDGGEGRFFALGTTSLKRGYYFGAPVWADGEPIGVVAVKIDIDSIEDTWRAAGDYRIIVTDPEGIIFMASEPDWMYHSVLPLTGERLARTAETRRYASAELRQLPIRNTGDADRTLYEIARNGLSTEYLVVSEAMPEADWTVSVLLDTSPARSQAITTMVVALLAIAMTILATAIVLQRRARLRERMQMQKDARELLELRVVERTAELASVNIKLEEEIAERRATELALRKTQADLIQAGKLAALGRMSADLSHEFNQPLAAARNFSDNALVLIDRGRIEEARSNVSRISALIERMTALSRHLRNFARKPNEKLSPVRLDAAIADALEILDWRIKAADIALTVDPNVTAFAVIGGQIRLQQVLVNILTNAIDAVEGTKDRRISVSAHGTTGGVALAIADSGPGVASGLGDRIFDPFFSTKGIGKGLGLGLSISYNIVKDFGGELRVSNHPEGGAVFTIELVSTATEPEMDAAQ